MTSFTISQSQYSFIKFNYIFSFIILPKKIKLFGYNKKPNYKPQNNKIINKLIKYLYVQFTILTYKTKRFLQNIKKLFKKSKMSSSTSQTSIQFAPIRSLDDFLLGSARFQLPTFNDLEKWGNRVVKNLLYYQTNYIILFSIIYLLMAILYPTKIIWGIIVKTLIISILMYIFTDNTNNIQNPYHKWYYLAGTLFIGYLLLVWYDAIFLSALTLFLAFLGTFAHASLRLRNIRNKVANMKETLVPATIPTPMGIFLNAMNITVDNLLS